MQSYYPNGWQPTSATTAPPVPNGDHHPLHFHQQQQHHHHQLSAQAQDYSDIPTWPPPYPINTGVAPFTDPQPAISQRDFFAHLDPAIDQPLAAGLKPKGLSSSSSTSNYKNDNSHIDDHNGSNKASAAAANPKRQRISRACDKCNQLRTKCDGREPCAHCVEFQQACTYDRIKKKRGKVPKAQQRQALERDRAARQDHNTLEETGLERGATEQAQPLDEDLDGQDGFHYPAPKRARLDSGADASVMNSTAQIIYPGIPDVVGYADPSHSTGGGGGGTAQLPSRVGRNAAATQPSISDASSIQNPAQPTAWSVGAPSDDFSHWSPSYSSPGLGNNVSKLFNFSLEEFAAACGDGGGVDTLTSAWRASPGIVNIGTPGSAEGREGERIKYPILEPLVPHISSIIPNWLACQLLESYFASSSNAVYHPASPYLFNLLYNKRTFLSPDPPRRRRRPALLASMLWIASRTSDASYLTSDPHTRSRTCKRLLELTIQLLNPLIHQPGAAESSVLGRYHLAEGRSIEDRLVELHAAGTGSRSGAVDDIGTYIHIATVVSASENKRASLRWWNAAWGFAREVQLGRELPPDPPKHDGSSAADSTVTAPRDLGRGDDDDNRPGTSEEEREERRRTWWLLYMMDRHLALCYNRPLFLLNRECDELLHPLNDIDWQEGRLGDSAERQKGPPLLFTDNSIFGFFLPLMTVLGEIVDLHGVKSHPRLGVSPEENSARYESRANAIRKQLGLYDASVQVFRAKLQEKKLSDYSAAEHEMQTAIAYSTYIMNVCHVLTAGKWDPIQLLEDSDDWLATPEGRAASEHAVRAACAASDLLEIDSDLSFMPYFLGIQLLQGSFLLLVLADKHQTEAGPQLIKACEDMARAHEACVVTLDTEYQRNFRKIMRAALAEVRGRCTEETKAQQQKRRKEVLSLYRWTKDGCGIAL